MMEAAKKEKKEKKQKMKDQITEYAFEVINANAVCGIFITCEHASQRLPPPWRWPVEDAHLLDSHWAVDLGARELALELAAQLSCCALLCRFSRLLVDANRELDNPTLMREYAERGLPVVLNRDITEEERQKRLDRCYLPYHRELESRLRSNLKPGGLVFSVHSFTDTYRPTDEPVSPRNMEAGLLVDKEEDLALEIKKALDEEGVDIRINEPYNGKGGLVDLMHSDPSLAPSYRYLAIECRQDLVTQKEWRSKMAVALSAAFLSMGLV